MEDTNALGAKGQSLSFEYLKIGDVRVRYFRVGVGPHLLLLHGWGARIETFKSLTSDLARTRSVHAFDFPGFGESSVPPEPWGIAEFVELSREVARRLQLVRPDIVAHSFGGRVAIKLAAEYPNEVGHLVLVGTPGIRSRRGMRYYSRIALAKIGRFVASRIPAARYWGDGLYNLVASKDLRDAGPLRGTFVKVVNENLSPYLERVVAPVLLIWGTNDKEVPIATARMMQRSMPNARLVEMAGGHFCFVEQSDYFRLLVEKFLREPLPPTSE
jgi:pimeloyl-ACP methyl ester carboxylesterase